MGTERLSQNGTLNCDSAYRFSVIWINSNDFISSPFHRDMIQNNIMTPPKGESISLFSTLPPSHFKISNNYVVNTVFEIDYRSD